MKHLSQQHKFNQLNNLIQTASREATPLDTDEFYRIFSYYMINVHEATCEDPFHPFPTETIDYLISECKRADLKARLENINAIFSSGPGALTKLEKENKINQIYADCPGFGKFLITRCQIESIPTRLYEPPQRFIHPENIYTRCTHTGRGTLEQRQFYEMYLWSMACINAGDKIEDAFQELQYIAENAPIDIIDTDGFPIQYKAKEIVHRNILHQKQRAALNAKHEQQQRELEQQQRDIAAIAETAKTGIHSKDIYIDHWVAIRSCIILGEPEKSYMPLVKVVMHCPDSLMYRDEKLKQLATKMWVEHQCKDTKTLPQVQVMPRTMIHQGPFSLPKPTKTVRFADLPRATPPSTPEAKSAYFP